MLASYSELAQFHFNEALCKPFENLLCLELCDGDIQDQVTSGQFDCHTWCLIFSLKDWLGRAFPN